MQAIDRKWDPKSYKFIFDYTDLEVVGVDYESDEHDYIRETYHNLPGLYTVDASKLNLLGTDVWAERSFQLKLVLCDPTSGI